MSAGTKKERTSRYDKGAASIKKTVSIFLCLFIMSTLSGCWSRTEPKHLAIINSVIYDMDDEGKYIVYTEFINASASASGGGEEGKKGASSLIADGKGDSPIEAISNVSQTVERSIFGGDSKIRFFSERLAKKDISDTIDYILRARLTDETAMISVIKGEEPQKIYEATIGLSDTLGNYMETMSLFQPNAESKAVFLTTLDFVRDFYSDGKQPVAGLIEVVENEFKSSESGKSDGGEKKYKIICEGLAAFKDGTLAGYFNGEEARAYNLIRNDVRNINITVPSENGNTVFNILKSKCGVKTSKEDDNIKIDVKLKVDSRIISESSDIEISQPETLKMLEELFNEKLKNEITGAVTKAQKEFESDIFGFGEHMHGQNPKDWRGLKKDWDEAFSKAEVNVSVESSIARSGELKRPFNYEEEDK